MTSSCSLTPPVSPVVEFQKDIFSSKKYERNIYWFSCKAIQHTSYLRSGHFQKWLDFCLEVSDFPSIMMFGKTFPSESTVWSNMHQLFTEVKKYYFVAKVVALENPSLLEDLSTTIENLRKDICAVLQFFQASIQSLNSKYSNFSNIAHTDSIEFTHIRNILGQVVKEIKNLLIIVGRISNVPNITNIKDFANDSGKSADYYYHYFHLCLDIWWNSLVILYIIHMMMPPKYDFNEIICTNSVDQSNSFAQLASLILSDFSCIALNYYKNLNIYGNSSPFPCTCFQDFWIMLIYMLDKNYLPSENNSFWCTYQSILQMIHKTSDQETYEVQSLESFCLLNNQLHFCTSAEACLWLTSHIAPLYKYDIYGHYGEGKTVRSAYAVVKYLILNLLSANSDGNEKTLRNALSYCIQFVLLWEPSGDILFPLTDFFIKKLDDMFCLPGTEVKQLSYLYKSSSSWFEYITHLSSESSLSSKNSSYDFYLQILSLQLKANASDGSLWRCLKGRVYSKFTTKKVKELSEVGLQNTYSLLLAIAASGHLEVMSKISDIASIIETTSSARKQTISWKALFALISICQHRNHNMDKIITQIAQFFNSACSDYSTINKDSMHKTNIMNLILVYIDNMGETFERSKSLNLSEYQLIGSGFSELLSSCGNTELNYILGIFLNILVKVQSVIGDVRNMECVTADAQHVGILEFIFNHIYPFIEKIAITDTPPPLVSDIVAALTNVTFKLSSLITNFPHNFHCIFSQFGSNKSINSSVMCRYLCFILDDSELMEGLKCKLPDLNILIVQSWLRCTIYLQCSHIYELTCKVLQQQEITELFPETRKLNFKTKDYIYLSIEFFRIMGHAHVKCHSLSEKALMQKKVYLYFKNYVSCVASRIKQVSDSASLNHVYKMISHLVEYCSPLLHMKFNSNSILPQLLNKTAFPHLMFPKEKALQSVISCAVKEYLPNFIRGLTKLDYRKDKCIEREIKDLIIHYIGLYPANNNPLTKLFIDSVNQKTEGLSLDAYEFILDMIKLNAASITSGNSVNIFEFCYEIFSMTPQSHKKGIANVLLKSAMELYMKHNEAHSEFLKRFIRKTLNHFRECKNINHSKTILIPIIQWFIQEKLQWSAVRGFSVLDIVIEYLPEVMSELIPFLVKSIEQLENSRGLGEDMLLRNGLRNTVAKLQNKLSPE